MKRALLLMTSGAIALLVGTGVNAATMTGKVVGTDSLTNAITIQTDDGTRFVFTRNDATKIEHKGVAVGLGDIPQNSRVTVTTEQAPTDPMVPTLATRVDVDEMAVAAAPSESVDTTAHVESAGADGGKPMRTAEVRSADTAPTSERLPRTATPLPLIAVLGAGSLASGLVLRLRRRR